jgi:hypothetical protein
MLTIEELTYLVLTLFVLWFFPLLTLLKTDKKSLSINIIVQLAYSGFFMWLLEYHGSKGSGLLWIFYWFFTIVIHLVGLNIWTIYYRRKIKTSTNNT